MVEQRKVNIVWLSWAIIWPLILWVSYQYYTVNIDGQWLKIFLFGLFMCLIALFPLTIQKKQIFLRMG